MCYIRPAILSFVDNIYNYYNITIINIIVLLEIVYIMSSSFLTKMMNFVRFLILPLYLVACLDPLIPSGRE